MPSMVVSEEAFMTIYVDNAGIAADVTDPTTGRTYSSRWCHLFSFEIDQTELHEFARRIGMRRAWFQPGTRLGRRVSTTRQGITTT